MCCEFTARDVFGRQLRLDHSNWQKHKHRHPEAVPYHDTISVVVSDPDIVIEASRDGHYHFYRLGLTRDRFVGHYVKVIVEYAADQTTGTIKTWWLPRGVDVQGSVRWIRPPAAR